MNVAYQADRLLINGEPTDIEGAAAIYAGMLIESITSAMEYSPELQREFFERLRPAASAYYGWRIIDEEQDKSLETIYDYYADEDDYEEDSAESLDEGQLERLLDTAVEIRIAANRLISELLEDEGE